ncbi:hypothetical protein AK812_SmicGene28134 [Symbiodinium microadriaticum]|uniref:Uncharacterized protein n=1 Tax=Symbiodinium microadriaticum TaxID=2951 RepID=A0A1Q9D530_SYMMI|nr:hypothetical protein AK812_SmicGene28134 [Symbiodinium microadriaticum]
MAVETMFVLRFGASDDYGNAAGDEFFSGSVTVPVQLEEDGVGFIKVGMQVHILELLDHAFITLDGNTEGMRPCIAPLALAARRVRLGSVSRGLSTLCRVPSGDAISAHYAGSCARVEARNRSEDFTEVVGDLLGALLGAAAQRRA